MNTHAPTDLRCEYMKNPLCVDTPAPRFSWLLAEEGRARRQASYQLLVGTDESAPLGRNAWDSGRVDSGETSQIVYDGSPLESCRRYFWCVRWWDDAGEASPWSIRAFFQMGLLRPSDWRARWITKRAFEEFTAKGSIVLGTSIEPSVQCHAAYFRKEFELPSAVHLATAYVCGLGLYELRVNGVKVGDHVLDPAQTDYRKLALYSAFDITDLLSGRNALGLTVGNGRHIRAYGYGTPCAIVQVVFEHRDLTRTVLATDGSWKASHGPLTENGLYGGERYDARVEMPGWDRPGFDDSLWEEAALSDGPPLRSQMLPPMRVIQTLPALSVKVTSPGRAVYDFGQNFTGWVRLAARGEPGNAIRIRHAELLHDDGTLNTDPNQNAEATDLFILRGEAVEQYEPRFTYHGFRYAEVSAQPGTTATAEVQGQCVSSDVDLTGDFSCSNSVLNRIHQNIVRGQRSNLMGIPTDCPQRDERMGWLGDAALSAKEAMFNFNMAAFYTKFLRDIDLAQRSDGSLPDTVPPYLGDLTYPADPSWGTAFVTIASLMYEWYGDTRILEEHYEAMKRYIEFLRSRAEEGIQRKLGKYGDWCPPGSIAPKKTPVTLTATWSYYHDVLLFSRIARVLGRREEEEECAALAEEIARKFNQAFLKSGEYEANRFAPADRSPSQTSNVLPLALGMVPAENVRDVLGRLLHSITVEHGGHLDTGIIGTRYLLDVLTAMGHGEVAYRIATQKSYPGWGYMLEQGATTLWERWEDLRGAGMNSHNHIMFGSIDAWFYEALAGVALAAPGWGAIRFRPPLFTDLSRAAARVGTPRGETRISWEREGDEFQVTLLVPVGSRAELHYPAPSGDPEVFESGRLIWQNGRLVEEGAGLTFNGRQGSYLLFGIGSGEYTFSGVAGARRPL